MITSRVVGGVVVVDDVARDALHDGLHASLWPRIRSRPLRSSRSRERSATTSGRSTAREAVDRPRRSRRVSERCDIANETGLCTRHRSGLEFVATVARRSLFVVAKQPRQDRSDGDRPEDRQHGPELGQITVVHELLHRDRGGRRSRCSPQGDRIQDERELEGVAVVMICEFVSEIGGELVEREALHLR